MKANQLTKTETLQLKPGYGYWDFTSYPVGGCFRRNGHAEYSPMTITDVEPLESRACGCDCIGRVGNRSVAFKRENCLA